MAAAIPGKMSALALLQHLFLMPMLGALKILKDRVMPELADPGVLRSTQHAKAHKETQLECWNACLHSLTLTRIMHHPAGSPGFVGRTQRTRGTR